MSDVSLRAFYRGIYRTKAAINKYAKGINKDAMEVCEALAYEAQDEAEKRYADYEGPDGDDVIVSDPELVKQGAIPVGYRIEATGSPIRVDGTVVGNTVVFEEFGSGLLAGSHPQSSWYPGIYPGSWSESPYGSKQYSTKGRWYYEGEVYVYIAPTYAMYLAGQKVRELAAQNMKEVFG